jgi:hypothetical protein
MTTKTYAIGSFEKGTDYSYARNCCKCGKQIWYSDDWNEEAIEWLCMECMHKVKGKNVIHQSTIDRINKTWGTNYTKKDLFKMLEKEEKRIKELKSK